VKLSRIFWLTILVHAAFASMRVSATLYGLHLGASELTVGVIMSLIAFLPMLISVHAGRMIDQVGPRRPMILGAILLVAGLSVVVAFPRLESLFFVTSICGLGFLFFHVAVHQAVGLIGTDRERMRNFSLLALAFSTSSFLGPMMAGFCIDWIGYRATFAASTVIAVLGLIAAISDKSDITRPKQAATATKRRALDLLKTPELRVVLAVSGVLSMCWDLFTFAVPIYGVRIGLSASQIGLVLGAFGVAIFVVRLVMPMIAHRMREWPLLIAAMIMTAAAFGVFPLIQSGLVLAALAFVCGFALGSAQPTIMTLIYRLSPAGRAGEAVGIRSLLLNISQTSVPLLSGAFGAAVGIAPAFWLMTVLLGFGSWHAHRRARLSRPA
jgi:predicted MFS family arabinose efflux permease